MNKGHSYIATDVHHLGTTICLCWLIVFLKWQCILIDSILIVFCIIWLFWLIVFLQSCHLSYWCYDTYAIVHQCDHHYCSSTPILKYRKWPLLMSTLNIQYWPPLAVNNITITDINSYSDWESLVAPIVGWWLFKKENERLPVTTTNNHHSYGCFSK